MRLFYRGLSTCSPFKFGLNPNLASKPQHIRHVPPLPHLTSYADASQIQEHLVRKNLDHKQDPSLPKPEPTLLSFEMNPVYTSGRRELGKLSQEMIQFFQNNGQAEFVETYRGGQTTFHGPGQLVVYPIIDLKQFQITPKCYVSLLEESIIDTLAHYNIQGQRTDNTGVWVSDTHKIAAIGIHVRRNVTSHGIALNVNTDTYWFDRIVACGLPDKQTTNMAACTEGDGLNVHNVANVFAQKMAANLHCTVL